MTTVPDVGGPVPGEHLDRLTENLSKVEALSKRLIDVMTHKTSHNPGLNTPDHGVFTKAAAAYWAQAVQNPAKVLEHQIEYWGKSVKHFAEAQQALASGKLVAPADPGPRDRRFANPLWDTHPYFNFIKQQYQINAEAIEQAVASVDTIDEIEKRRLKYFARQIVDLMSPTNYLATNPDALERALETEGQSLVDGLENLIADLEANQGELVVRLADESAFQVGGNIATSPGEVVYRNRMMEIVQYSPTTETVHEIPIVLFPPWINKFYILDLKPQNSLIKWIVEQGYTLFVVSWVNPDESYADVGMEDYIEDGFLTALREVKAICKTEQVNAVGYCIAGTTLALVLALLHKRGDKSVKSATFFTTLTDFADQGEFTPFLQNDFVDAIEEEVKEKGILRSYIMARTFSFLRSNDLIYSPAIRSYMMGEAPPAFDLLFWNGDGTNLPGKMAVQYLRGLCQRNEFCSDGFELCGETLRVKDVTVPLMSISCETDHIAAWRDCYRGVRQMGSRSKQFIVSQSGHVAGIVNPPSKKKYGHYTNPDLSGDAETWMNGATFNEGSWWPQWGAWLSKRAGKQVPARVPGDSEHPSLGAAPGTYVASTTSL
ncbi:class I poly(R)-hydroxyalkanoic acid synthase [Pseudodonghicola xiamenensis]|uniref:Class I poly(R)-hydroxyalkanoic acid synthase n=1 Tax=Pseudodonghicola xiamenensis TaxID=337702 RepID=A0A8J3MD71_9RHOB|nr:class I poly(R)-hydroxyalkanoic acid synthase [Pseudodonghicola xiamenensis]TNE48612.1 MAG: class I poly(R)-hydroxyalkanoic acid synthase [Sphingomonadales bacterium]GHG90517.1 class I poly(R)-hydroxyalkanoic acid synthase [Pseudodonghicola xiamenensis]